MTNAPPPPLIAETGVRFGMANALIVTAMFAAGATRLDLTGTEVLVVLIAGLAGTGLPRLVTASLGLVSCAMVTGFAENQDGVLTFAGHDVDRLLIFVVMCRALPAAVHHVAVHRAVSHHRAPSPRSQARSHQPPSPVPGGRLGP
jgi:hypothetical protein